MFVVTAELGTRLYISIFAHATFFFLQEVSKIIRGYFISELLIVEP